MTVPAENVSFAIALPDGWEQIDLLAPDAEQILDGQLAAALAFAARGTEDACLLMLRSLVTVAPDGRPLAAGLSVALAGPSAPVSSRPLDAEAFMGAEVTAITLPVGSGVRVLEVARTGARVAGELLRMLKVQYLIHTAHGLLTITLATAQVSATEEWEQLFDAMAATSELA
jgi:hypothetical protein